MKFFDGITSIDMTVVFGLEFYQETTDEQKEMAHENVFDIIYDAMDNKFNIYYWGDIEDDHGEYKLKAGISVPAKVFSCPGSNTEPDTFEADYKITPEDLRDDIQKKIDSLLGEEVAWLTITEEDKEFKE